MNFLKRAALYLVLIIIMPPFCVGFVNSFTKPAPIEQRWLDNAICQLQTERAICTDPETCEALDYTIQRYNKIGPWDVMITKFYWPFDIAIGMNLFYCPGLSLDPDIMGYPIELGANILLHESVHDYYPYFHPAIDDKMRRVKCL